MKDIEFVQCPHCDGRGAFMRFTWLGKWTQWFPFKDDVFENVKNRLREKLYCHVCGGRTEVTKTKAAAYRKEYGNDRSNNK